MQLHDIPRWNTYFTLHNSPTYNTTTLAVYYANHTPQYTTRKHRAEYACIQSIPHAQQHTTLKTLHTTHHTPRTTHNTPHISHLRNIHHHTQHTPHLQHINVA